MNASAQVIDALLRRISALLSKHNETEWARSFEHFAVEYSDSPQLTKGRIRSVYGGMGSFNDLILHGPDGIPLGPENDELDQLRSELYAKCRS